MALKEDLKKVIVEGLFLEDIKPEEIKDDELLFGNESLGLDSLDAVELVVQIQKHFGVEIKNIEEGTVAFQSINTLAAFIEERQ